MTLIHSHISNLKKGLSLLFLLSISIFGYGQLGYSSASMSMSKMSASAGFIPDPDHVIVEEYFNYHKHVIPIPENDQPITIDIAGHQAADNDFILQIGLATGTYTELEEIPSVNVCLVIDRSGSMGGDRIEKAKEATIEFIQRLREKDRLSVVIFDNEIEVLIPSQHVTNKNKLIAIVRSVQARGSTDLNGGIIRGYQEVAQHYRENQANKLIVLTDALTNTGEVDPDAIVKNSKKYSAEHSIQITMVGVGVDFNNALSRQISKGNHSSIFFINDAADIKKIFIDEIESLLSPVALNPTLVVDLPEQVNLIKCFGYEPTIKGNQLHFELENMNSGLTQVFLLKLQSTTSNFKLNEFVSAQLNFTHACSKESETIKVSTKPFKRDFDHLDDLKKNYAIARMAQCIEDVTILYKSENLTEAKRRSDYILSTTRDNYAEGADEDIDRVYNILSNYKKTIANELSESEVSTLTFPY